MDDNNSGKVMDLYYMVEAYAQKMLLKIVVFFKFQRFKMKLFLQNVLIFQLSRADVQKTYLKNGILR